ncbi:MAG TPA: glycosyltransferase family 4 protein [Candidatus Acidoferrales bacterium]|nr:glycosyltransferase family 4 protein [Candidatus Acidoferrales bacterium]
MKIIHLGNVAGFGGMQNWLCRLAEAQARRGFDVQLMTPPWEDTSLEVHTWLPVISWDLDRVRDFDLTHTHGTSGFHNRRIRREIKKPIVHSYYGTTLGCQIALRWFQNLVGWDGFGTLRNIRWEALGGRHAHAVIANSPMVRSEIRTFCRVRSEKIAVIPGGYARDGSYPPRESLRRELGLPEKGFLFLFVGRRADPVKNLPAAIEAFRRVRLRFPDAHLVLAPKQDMSIGDGITGVELPPQKMNLLYRCTDALVHPGFYEAYSLAVHEALVNGLPVIVGRNTGNADYCTHGQDALVLPRARGSKLVDSLAEMMYSLIESEELRTKLGKEAARKFGPMDWEWVESETAKVYSRL